VSRYYRATASQLNAAQVAFDACAVRRERIGIGAPRAAELLAGKEFPRDCLDTRPRGHDHAARPQRGVVQDDLAGTKRTPTQERFAVSVQLELDVALLR
jgi:hypothetical protein